MLHKFYQISFYSMSDCYHSYVREANSENEAKLNFTDGALVDTIDIRLQKVGVDVRQHCSDLRYVYNKSEYDENGWLKKPALLIFDTVEKAEKWLANPANNADNNIQFVPVE